MYLKCVLITSRVSHKGHDHHCRTNLNNGHVLCSHVLDAIKAYLQDVSSVTLYCTCTAAVQAYIHYRMFFLSQDLTQSLVTSFVWLEPCAMLSPMCLLSLWPRTSHSLTSLASWVLPAASYLLSSCKYGTHTRMHAHTTRLHTHMHACTHSHTQHMRTHTCMHAHTQHMRTHVHTRTTHKHTRTTHVHTHTTHTTHVHTLHRALHLCCTLYNSTVQCKTV